MASSFVEMSHLIFLILKWSYRNVLGFFLENVKIQYDKNLGVYMGTNGIFKVSHKSKFQGWMSYTADFSHCICLMYLSVIIMKMIYYDRSVHQQNHRTRKHQMGMSMAANPEGLYLQNVLTNFSSTCHMIWYERCFYYEFFGKTDIIITLYLYFTPAV